MLLENRLNRKALELYRMLSRSDLNGNLEDEFVITLIYTIRCLDNIRRDDKFIPDHHIVDLAKEIIRVYETCENTDANDISIMSWTKVMVECMKENNLRYKDIHKMSTVDLIDKLLAVRNNSLYPES